MSRYELQLLGEAESNEAVAANLEQIAEEIRAGEHSGSFDIAGVDIANWTLSVYGPDLD